MSGAAPGGARPWLLRTLLGALLLAAAFLFWHWFTTNFERRVQEVDTGWSAAARQNPFLAAERFLAGLGLTVSSVHGRGLLRDLPAPTDTLLVRGLGPLNGARQQALLAWIEAGGHLVCEAMEATDADAAPRPTDFLASQGVLLRNDGDDTDDDDDAEAAPDAGSDWESEPDDDPASAATKAIGDEWNSGQSLLRVDFGSGYYLEDVESRALESWHSDGLPRVLRLPLGDGRLTVLADTTFMTNRHIGEADHALFLARLLDPGGRTDGRLWIIYDSAVPDLATLLWRQAPLAIVAGALLILLGLWTLGARLGPLHGEPPRAQRNLLAHLVAAGGFLWRHGRGQVHLGAARRRVERAWLRRHPRLRALGPPARAHWLAQRTGLPTDAIMTALYRQSGAPDELADARTLQQLWAALNH